MPSFYLSVLSDTAVAGVTFSEYLEAILNRPWSLPFVDALAILAGFTTAVLALVYFAMRRDVVVPILAVALCGIGVIEMYSTIQPDPGVINKIVGIANRGGMPIAHAHATTLTTLILAFTLARLIFLRQEKRCRTAPFVGMCVLLVVLTVASVHVFRGDLLPGLMHRATLPPPWNFISVVTSGALLALLSIKFHAREQTIVSAGLAVSLIPYLTSQVISLFPESAVATRVVHVGAIEIESLRLLRLVAYSLPFACLTVDFLRCYTEHGARARTLARVPDGRSRKLRRVLKDLRNQQAELKIAKGMHESANKLLGAQTEELVLARQAADDASAAKSAFLASMSHEIRTPMTAILGLAEDLQGSELSEEERRESIEIILDNSRYLLEIVNEILDLSKIEAGELRIERVRCSPGAIVAEIDSLMRPRAEKSGLAFEIVSHDPIPESIETDPIRLRQILINLTGNAIKFTEEGSVRVEYGLAETDGSREPQAAGEIEFRVIDTGIGIDEAGQLEIFDPFSQADDWVERSAKGTGLGLAICRELTAALGGVIEVSSRPGEGSTFAVRIAAGDLADVAMVERPHENIRRAPEKKAVEEKPAFDCRILLAEDNDTIRLFVRRLLTMSGADVVEATDGQEAVSMSMAAMAEGNPFDVVLMDMQMPVLDGFEATRDLRRRNYAGPIVAMTAGAMEQDRERFLAAGCNDFTRKPIDRDHLFDTIHRLVARD